MATRVEAFTDFYNAKFQHRATFEVKRIKLVVSTHQVVLLILFNDNDRLSYSEIKSKLNMNDKDLHRVLQSLSDSKYKILKKISDSQTINDCFEFNSKFDNPMRKIRICLPPSMDEKKKVREEVDKCRRYAIDATVVKDHEDKEGSDLPTCIEMLSANFKPDVKLIKARIEDMINKIFLERDAQDYNLFR